jgi:hypothetical protein
VSAKEMFEKLEYELVFENEEVLRYKKNKWLDVEFWKVYEKITGEKMKKYIKVSNVHDRPYFISIELLQAINKQVEELGWNNDNN